MTKKIETISVPAFKQARPELNNFLTGAETDRQAKASYPWEEPYVKTTTHKHTFGVRLPLESYLKLQYIQKHKGVSMHSVLLEPVIKLIEEEAKKLMIEGHK